jgi:hypothetical protein
MNFGAQPGLVLEGYEGDILDLDLTTKEGQWDYIAAIGQAAKGIAHLHNLALFTMMKSQRTFCIDIMQRVMQLLLQFVTLKVHVCHLLTIARRMNTCVHCNGDQ